MKTKKKKKSDFFKKLLNSLGHGFNMVAKLIMLIVCIGTGILSVFYTGRYMSSIIENTLIAYLISSTMYAYGLIGLNYADVFRLQKRYIMSLIFYITSICTILFSMSTSLMVNGEKYYTNKVQTENTTINNGSSNDYEFELLKNSLEDSNKEIERLEKLVEAQQEEKTADRTWVIDEEHPNGYYKITSYTLTKDAKEKINNFNELIENEKIKKNEIQNKLVELSKVVSSSEDETVKIKTFTQMIAFYLHIDAYYIQLFMILFCSVFIDIISPLALMIAKNKEPEEVVVVEKPKKVRKPKKQEEKEELIVEEEKEISEEEKIEKEDSVFTVSRTVPEKDDLDDFFQIPDKEQVKKEADKYKNKLYVKDAEKELEEMLKKNFLTKS